MSILGTRVLRREDPAFLTVGGTYVADVRDPVLDGAAYVTYVRSEMAHALIRSIDAAAATAMPGVVAVFTAADLDTPPAAHAAMTASMGFPANLARPLLAIDRVRFVGELVAIVVTEQPYQGPDAAAAVIVDYEPLPVVLDPLAGRADGAPLLHPDHASNVCFDIAGMGVPTDFADDFFAACEVTASARIVNQRVAACPLEVRSAAAGYAADGRLTMWASSQGAQQVRDELIAALGLAEGSVRVIAGPDVGGGFGPKIGTYPEELLVGWCVGKLRRPVRWVETRTENMIAMGHGRDQVQFVTIGGTADGTVTHYRIDIVHDCGAYPLLGAFLPFLTHMMATGCYDIANLETRAVSVMTNKVPTVAYRGAGRPEAAAAIERAMDLFADAAGLDPAAVRVKNFIQPDQFPFATKSGAAVYDCGDYPGALERLLALAGYDGLLATQAARRAAGGPRQLGIGLAVYVETTGDPDGEHGRVTVHADGSATVFSGSSAHGQGHKTAWSMLAANELGIPMERITVIEGDTDLVPQGVGTFGSRSLQLGGVAVLNASRSVVTAAKSIAARLLEADDADVVLDTDAGRFHVAGTPAHALGWVEVVAAADDAELTALERFAPPSGSFPFGAHLAVVEVDTDTGKVVLQRFVSVDDSGTILNPVIAEGQRHGGIAQGVGQALLEQVSYDADGNPQSANFADYLLPSAAELPSFELGVMETPTPLNPLGAKGIGESGTIGATPAVQNAVVDALSAYGVRHVDIPASPERVWRALHEQRT